MYVDLDVTLVPSSRGLLRRPSLVRVGYFWICVWFSLGMWPKQVQWWRWELVWEAMSYQFHNFRGIIWLKPRPLFPWFLPFDIAFIFSSTLLSAAAAISFSSDLYPSLLLFLLVFFSSGLWVFRHSWSSSFSSSERRWYSVNHQMTDCLRSSKPSRRLHTFVKLK